MENMPFVDQSTLKKHIDLSLNMCLVYFNYLQRSFNFTLGQNTELHGIS
jgi:hypothetical protein